MNTAKKFIYSVTILFAISGLILLFGKAEWFPAFYQPSFMACISFISIALIFLPKQLFSSDNPEKSKAISRLQVIIAVAVLCNGVGGLWLFQTQFDKAVHFFVPFLFTLIGTDVFRLWRKMEFAKAIKASGLAVIIGGLVWEVLEFFSDNLLHTRSLGYYGQDILVDTALDLFFDFLAVIVAYLVAKKYRNTIFQ